MKPAILAILTTATTAMASPQQPLGPTITLSETHASISADGNTGMMDMNVQNPVYQNMNNIPCAITWNPNNMIPSSMDFDCHNGVYNISFPNGLSDIATFSLAVKYQSMMALYNLGPGGDWLCQFNTNETTREYCYLGGTIGYMPPN
ncbi:hypothetical protein BO78DRAFT_131751 [Aspergillus sclerotiicarbonarius CBS 121057]|uniref:AA1-like domain-containing protein n=1 Tax=Aspergillus sclerotiicarbonarius (strain CBS 121057 / IBT 28362) TaxID=1448318 RepID=A0A319EUH3_ASPSB|nr:hypothetical protein BO78DRAFT_131751 [Aspergillus sclerotiicarbonarius CBS 121057]